MEQTEEKKEEEVVVLKVSVKHAKRLATRNKMLNLLVGEILDRHGIAGNLRMAYGNFARKLIKIVTEMGHPVWRKLAEIEKTRFIEYNGLNKDAVNEIADTLLKIFEDAYKEIGEIDLEIVDFVLVKELEKRNLLKKLGVRYGGGETGDLDTRETVAKTR
jgi:hypothetical protein